MKPELQFSKWIRWKDRRKYPQGKLPGVYMLAITNKDLEGQNPRFEDVVYIGMTNSRGGLISRWNQFDNSIHNKPEHSGGKTVFRDLGDSNIWKFKLFVCVLPVDCNVLKDTQGPEDLIQMGWIAFLEYEAMAVYKKAMRKEPKYNTK